ncbi:MAG: tRNA-dihydrouridine synthase family protein [archaeon]
MLAPMEDITSNAFRTVCHKYGADLTFTEFARVEALARKNKSTWSRLDFKDETPIVIQLLGAKEYYFKKFLSMFEPHKGFQGFNLNCGCPSPDVIKLGQGCALVRRISKTRKIVSIFKDRGFKISVKMRLGLNQRDKENKVYLNLIDAVDADFFVVHARYGMQRYDEPADFKVYEECVRKGKDIVANGGITTKEHIEYLKSVGVKGAMIGRAAVNDPVIFSRLKGLAYPDIEDIKKEYLGLAEKYSEPFRYRKNVLKHIGKNSFKIE